jgi:hypothetical protein
MVSFLAAREPSPIAFFLGLESAAGGNRYGDQSIPAFIP